MTLSEELSWRGFVNQTTFKDITALDQEKYKFYWGVDPSADSMQVGNLATAMMVMHFINYGYPAYLLVGGATGLIGDPDGKISEREIRSTEEIANNANSLAAQYKQLFADKDFTLVNNNDWFSDFKYLDFLRKVGKHVPMRQMLGRTFIQTRLGDDGPGISYAEFSYVLIQAYDFLHLNKEYGVSLQLCGADQWGNSIAGVDLIRRTSSNLANVWSGPLVVNPQTGIKFGKSEDGAVWLDAKKTSPASFYQFWVNSEDSAVEHYLKIFTLLSKEEIESIISHHNSDPKKRLAQISLADQVTQLVHGSEAMQRANSVMAIITGAKSLGESTDEDLSAVKQEIVSTKTSSKGSIIEALTTSGLASSKQNARQLIKSGAVYINNARVESELFQEEDFTRGHLLLRRGKAYKDSVLIELIRE